MLRVAATAGGIIAMCAILLGSARSAGHTPAALRALPIDAAWHRADAVLWSARARLVERHLPERPVPPAPLAMRVIARDEKLDVVPFDGRGMPRPDAFA